MTTRPFKITLPGPLTLATQITKGGPYKDRIEIAADLATLINRELRALAAGGARNLQLDDVYQSFIMEPKRLVELYDRCFDGVAVERRFWHICFGTLEGFGYGERAYRPLFPTIASASADQLVFEYANREMAESELWREFDCPKELGAGVLDLKNFYVESPELVARRSSTDARERAGRAAVDQPGLRPRAAPAPSGVRQAPGAGHRHASSSRRALPWVESGADVSGRTGVTEPARTYLRPPSVVPARAPK